GGTLAGIHAALGVLLALWQRDRSPEQTGQVVDVAIYEAIFNMLEGVVPEFDGAGVVREPSGSTVTGIVPTNTYRCRDDKYVVIGGNADTIFKRLMTAAGRPDLADDPRLADNTGRVRHEAEIDAAISAWTATLDSATVLDRLETAAVPVGPIYSVREMMTDPHYQARGMFEKIDVNGESLRLPAMVPKLSATPGETRWAGPDVGSHNQEIYGELLGLSEAELSQLAEDGVI
ncbi:MAG: CoA transferase, partial [Gammaproteobacteria bacterium]